MIELDNCLVIRIDNLPLDEKSPYTYKSIHKGTAGTCYVQIGYRSGDGDGSRDRIVYPGMPSGQSGRTYMIRTKSDDGYCIYGSLTRKSYKSIVPYIYTGSMLFVTCSVCGLPFGICDVVYEEIIERCFIVCDACADRMPFWMVRESVKGNDRARMITHQNAGDLERFVFRRNKIVVARDKK